MRQWESASQCSTWIIFQTFCMKIEDVLSKGIASVFTMPKNPVAFGIHRGHCRKMATKVACKVQIGFKFHGVI